MSFKRLILGSRLREVDDDYDKTLLAAYIMLLYIAVDVVFLIVNLFNPEGDSFKILQGVAISVGCLYLLRRGWRYTAILIQLTRANYLAYHFTSIDANMTGNFVYFMAAGMGALALFGYSERWVGILFSLSSLVLCYVSMFDIDKFSPSEPHFFLILNLTISYVMGFVIIYSLNQLTYFSRSKLNEKNVQLGKVNSEMDRFVYSVSHDLRAPLSSISGLINLSERSSDPAEIKQYLELMKGRIVKLEQFIRDIINFSRNARVDASVEEVDVRGLIHETFETLKFINGADSIAIHNKLPEPFIVKVDRSRLQMVLYNLISNAIHYRDPYKDAFIHFRTIQENDRIVVEVSDNGVGIAEQHIPKVFDMFYRASENSVGSGLGLYIVKEAMEKIGGQVTVRSTLGAGTSFMLSLPRTAQS